MSFFNNLQQYVTNSVANLNLSPRRFSLQRPGQTDASGPLTPAETNQRPLSLTTQAKRPTGPRAVPHVLQERSKSLRTVPVTVPAAVSPGTKRNARTSSLKEIGSSASAAVVVGGTPVFQQPSKRTREPKLRPSFAMFNSPRRTSWPQFAITGSGVQECDGSFFESFTALCWKQDNRRLQMLREDDQLIADRHDELRYADNNHFNSKHIISPKELEQLYIEVLYTIRHKIGAHSAQYPYHYQEDLIRYAQAAFSIGPEQHRRCQAVASEEKAPIIVLNVIVTEAEGLEAKDPNGFSDPYCMLGIQPGGSGSCEFSSGAEQNELGERRSSLASAGHNDRLLKKHHSFRLSFKRKESSSASTAPANHSGSRGSISSTCSSNSSAASGSGAKEHRDSLTSALPAKFIRATSVKQQTLNPKWNEKFKFDIDDVSTDILHLDIWDHDDEYSVLDAVSKLNEVRGVKGLGRFFKQIAQSARSGNQDDFLGCVNIPIQDIPSTGLEKWYKLEGRSHRSTIQGRLRLKMWLSTREDFGNSEEDNWTDIKQQEQLHAVFIDYELARLKNSHQWSGDLSQAALTILHQHAIQGDVTTLQSAIVRWSVVSRKVRQSPHIHYSLLYNLLQQLEDHWTNDQLSRDEEELLGDSFTSFVDFGLSEIRKLRICFPVALGGNLSRLEYLLKCLMYLEESQAFRRCCPFHREIRGEIISSVRKGVVEFYAGHQEKYLSPLMNVVHQVTGLISLTNAVHAELTRSSKIYSEPFERICNVPHFVICYKNFMKLVMEDFSPRLETICSYFYNGSEIANDLVSPVFELFAAIHDLHKFQKVLEEENCGSHVTNWNFHECFRPALEYWIALARNKAHARVQSAIDVDSTTNVEPYLKHSTSAIDSTSCFYQICEFWKQLSWPDLVTSYPLVYAIVEIITTSAVLYADLIFQRVQNSWFFDEDHKGLTSNEDIAVNLNNLEHLKQALNTLPQNFQISSVIAAVDGTLTVERNATPCRSRSPSVVGATFPGQSYSSSTSSYENSARQTFYSILDSTNEYYEAKLLRIAGHIAEKMRADLKKNIFHLAWSPDSLPADEASAPLLDFLDQKVSLLQPGLLPAAFQRCVLAIWDVLLNELCNQAESTTGEKFCSFYERLFHSLQILLEFFHAEGKGVPEETLQTLTYHRVQEKIYLHKTDTDQLIDIYHAKRLEDQQQQQHSSENPPYGILSVRAYFHHDSLCVEVLSARNVIPLDPNGLSDPFVIIELLPRRIFTNCSEQQTSVQKKTLNPVFDECFEFPVTLEQCRMDSAMLLFTVMDYDVLTANDFAGEALLSLNTLPGVAAGSQTVDTLHGLKQVDLVLMHQQHKNHPILSVLESRTWDRHSQDFVRRQKDRIAA